MRFFIAVPIPEATNNAVAALMTRLRRFGADVKWVKAENLHLTLSFLGERPKEEMPAIRDAMRACAAGRKAFRVVYSGIGVFESWDRPRVLWLGIDSGARELKELADDLAERLKAAGIEALEKGRPFAAHLTLGRFRSRRHGERLRASAATIPTASSLEMPVDRLILYESRLSPEGPSYAAIAEAGLPAALGA